MCRQGALRQFLARLMIGGVVCAACGPPAAPAPAVLVEWKTTPPAPIVDAETLVELALLDTERRAVRGATLRVEAFMSHPGMAPVIESAAERDGGVYIARLRLPMAGAWVLLVKGELADRRPINQRVGEMTALGADRGQAKVEPGI